MKMKSFTQVLGSRGRYVRYGCSIALVLCTLLSVQDVAPAAATATFPATVSFAPSAAVAGAAVPSAALATNPAVAATVPLSATNTPAPSTVATTSPLSSTVLSTPTVTSETTPVSPTVVVSPTLTPSPASSPGDVTTYLGSITRTGFNAAETKITVSSADRLELSWSLDDRGSYVSTQPIVANGIVYWGDYNGYEHATSAATGKDIWAQYLGSYYAGSSGNPTYCTPDQMGVVGSPTIADVNGRTLVFVPGGGQLTGTSGPDYFFALDARNGQVVWRTMLGATPLDTLWSSPAFFDGSIYEGVAGQGGCPAHADSRMVKLDAATGALQATFHLVPDGCVGGDVWGSPAIDEVADTVYFATGDQDNKCLGKEPMAQAVVELSAANLGYIGSWKLNEASDMDHDFGSTPTLFSSGDRQLVGVVNKNGVFYAFARDHISAGPVWIRHIADPGEASPEVGDGSVSPASWDGTTLYVGGGTSIDKKCDGTVEALNPATGKVKWSDCVPGPVIPAVVGAPGIVVVGAGSHLLVLDAVNGNVLWKWLDPRETPFWSAPTIANGMLFAANSGWAEPGRSWAPGRLYAFTLANGPIPTPTPVPNVCPGGWSCQDIGNPNVASSDLLKSGTWTVISGGGDIWATGDQFHFDYKTVLGNTSVSVQVRSQSYSDPWAKAGVMLRGDVGPGAAFYDALVTPSNGVVVQYRSPKGVLAAEASNVTGAVPLFLRVSRVGSTFSAYTSADGAHWSLIQDSTVTLKALSGPVLAGLAVTAHNLIDAGTVTYRAVSIAAAQFATVTPTPMATKPARTPTPVTHGKTIRTATPTAQGS